MKLNYMGVPVFMNGQNYYIPSLNYLDFRANYDLLTSALKFEGLEFFDFISKVIPVIGLAVRRNYPDVTDAQLADWLDATTFPLALAALQNASGMKPVSEGEDRPVAAQ